ncbi:putative molybdenum carrier protein [Haloferula sp. A504]|uniref:putative molybdenum carrier protein n=1 Tax=Haloferula sp. A504 TaxID=3373601 RepID=UPI0031CB0A97|nr:putative molybdenum carrier protein [Verrucomicrobiaceae bacterium E54]
MASGILRRNFIPVIEKLVSGGQTGADIAALDVALRHKFPHGGWCPKGRKSEAGPIPDRYRLQETPSASYLQRTEWNARHTDGTVIFTLAAKLTGGSLRTAEFARKHGKPLIHLSRSGGPYNSAEQLQGFVDEHGIRVLNVAGSRDSKEPELYSWVIQILEDAFFWSENHPGALGGPGEG